MNNKGLRKLFLAGVSCCWMLAMPLAAQSTDNTTWMTMGVKHQLSKKFDLSGGVEWRTKDDVSETDRWGLKLGTQYKALPFLKLGVGYEMHYRNRDAASWKIRHRYYWDGTLSTRWKDWKVSLRERFQHTLDGHKDELRLRSRMKLAYDLPSCVIEPYVSVEMFNGLNGGEHFDVVRMRYRGGISFPVLSCMDMEVFYCRQWEEHKDKNIFGLEASFKF